MNNPFKKFKELRTYKKVMYKTQTLYFLTILILLITYLLINWSLNGETTFQIICLIIYVGTLLLNLKRYIDKIVKGRFIELRNHYENIF